MDEEIKAEEKAEMKSTEILDSLQPEFIEDFKKHTLALTELLKSIKDKDGRAAFMFSGIKRLASGCEVPISDQIIIYSNLLFEVQFTAHMNNIINFGEHAEAAKRLSNRYEVKKSGNNGK